MAEAPRRRPPADLHAAFPRTSGAFAPCAEGSPSDVTARVIRDVTGAAPSSMGRDEIIGTCIFPMIDEGVRIMEDDKAQRASDIDVIRLNGYGWSADKGGPMFYGDVAGPKAVLARMEALGADDPEFAPAETLKRLASEGGRFTGLDLGGLRTRKG